MASEISWRHSATGATLYATIRTAARTMWNGSSLEALTVANWGDYDIALTETPASSYFYVGSWPAALSTAGWYWVDIFAQAGESPAISDTLQATMLGYWDGTTFSPWSGNTSQVAGTAQTAVNLGDLADGGRLDLLIDAIKAVTDKFQWTGSVNFYPKVDLGLIGASSKLLANFAALVYGVSPGTITTVVPGVSGFTTDIPCSNAAVHEGAVLHIYSGNGQGQSRYLSGCSLDSGHLVVAFAKDDDLAIAPFFGDLVFVTGRR